MAFLLLEHAWKELFDQDEVRDKVDFEDLVEEHRRCVKNGLAGSWFQWFSK